MSFNRQYQSIFIVCTLGVYGFPGFLWPDALIDVYIKVRKDDNASTYVSGLVVLKLQSNSNAQSIIAFYRGVLSLKDGIPTLF